MKETIIQLWMSTMEEMNAQVFLARRTDSIHNSTQVKTPRQMDNNYTK